MRYVHPDEAGNFFLVAHHDYDQHLSVLYSEESNFKVEFEYKIEPNIINIFDFQTLRQNDDFIVRVATSRDDSFNLNIAKFKVGEDIDYLKQGLSNCIYSSDSFSPMQAVSVKWPYLAYSGLNKEYLMLINMFDKDTIHRIKLQDEALVIQTYITETNDLFVMSQTKDCYRLQFIDLDASNFRQQDKPDMRKIYDQFRVQDVFEYTIDSVNQSPLLKMHVRGSSRKEVIDTNEKLIVLLLHSNCLYYKVLKNKT